MATMVRLIDGVFYDGKPGDEFELSIHRLGNGHAEASLRRMVWWEESRAATPDELEAWERAREEDAEKRREQNLGRAARRATTNVRRRVKGAGMDALLTLTYRALQPDLDLCKRHLKEFVRRMRRLIPGWAYVAAFELQKRGCWHVHMAIRKLPLNLPAANGVKVKSYGVVRAVWRSVVGHDNGNIDQARRKAFSRHSSGKLASYISKYMLKTFRDGDEWSNRYSAGGLDALPAPERVRFSGSRMTGEMLQRIYDAIHTSGCECWATLRRTWNPDECRMTGPPDGFFLSTGPKPQHMEFHYG